MSEWLSESDEVTPLVGWPSVGVPTGWCSVKMNWLDQLLLNHQWDQFMKGSNLANPGKFLTLLCSRELPVLPHECEVVFSLHM